MCLTQLGIRWYMWQMDQESGWAWTKRKSQFTRKFNMCNSSNCHGSNHTCDYKSDSPENATTLEMMLLLLQIPFYITQRHISRFTTYLGELNAFRLSNVVYLSEILTCVSVISSYSVAHAMVQITNCILAHMNFVNRLHWNLIWISLVAI